MARSVTLRYLPANTALRETRVEASASRLSPRTSGATLLIREHGRMERERAAASVSCVHARLQSFSHSPSRKKRSNFDICGAHKTENGSARFSTPLFFHASVCRPVGGERRRERRSKGRALMRGRRCLVLTGAVAGEEGICRHEDYFKYFCFYCDFMAKMKLIP